jgi:predicted dithiol-disulfide oxidoreductase (DUF899 family)
MSDRSGGSPLSSLTTVRRRHGWAINWIAAVGDHMGRVIVIAKSLGTLASHARYVTAFDEWITRLLPL